MLFCCGAETIHWGTFELEILVGLEFYWIFKGFGEVRIGNDVLIFEARFNVGKRFFGELLLDLAVNLCDCLLAVSWLNVVTGLLKVTFLERTVVVIANDLLGQLIIRIKLDIFLNNVIGKLMPGQGQGAGPYHIAIVGYKVVVWIFEECIGVSDPWFLFDMKARWFDCEANHDKHDHQETLSHLFEFVYLYNFELKLLNFYV